MKNTMLKAAYVDNPNTPEPTMMIFEECESCGMLFVAIFLGDTNELSLLNDNTS